MTANGLPIMKTCRVTCEKGRSRSGRSRRHEASRHRHSGRARGLPTTSGGTAVAGGPTPVGPGRRRVIVEVRPCRGSVARRQRPSVGCGRSPPHMSCRGTGRSHEGMRLPGTVARSFWVSVRKSAPGPILVSPMVSRESVDPVSAFLGPATRKRNEFSHTSRAAPLIHNSLGGIALPFLFGQGPDRDRAGVGLRPARHSRPGPVGRRPRQGDVRPHPHSARGFGTRFGNEVVRRLTGGHDPDQPSPRHPGLLRQLRRNALRSR